MESKRPAWATADYLFLGFGGLCALLTWLSVMMMQAPRYGDVVLAFGLWGLSLVVILPGMYCWLGRIRPKDPMSRVFRWGGICLYCLPFLRFALF